MSANGFDMNKLDLASLLEKLLGSGGGHPLGALLQLFQGQSSPSSEEQRSSERASRLQKRKLALLGKANRLFQQRNEFLASGLGACTCWGQDAECETCDGEGLPGYFVPEQGAFEALVVPLLKSQSALVEAHLHGDDKRTNQAG